MLSTRFVFTKGSFNLSLIGTDIPTTMYLNLPHIQNLHSI